MKATRRQFLAQTVYGTAASSALPVLCHAQNARKETKPMKPAFLHRSCNGWITDIATEPDPMAPWPSIRLDDALLEDYRRFFAAMKQAGFNEIVIWGLYVANSWKPDLEHSVSAERGRRVERLIGMAHAQGIKVISGLGTYSWGFAEIIKANPKLNRGNPNAMCLTEPESERWMQRVVDYVFRRFPIDGVSMQSADQGRCPCERCRLLSDAEYHATAITRTADYIRSKHSKKLCGMSNWGVPFSKPEDRETLARMSRSLDYMIDYNDGVRHGGTDYRKQFIAALHCPFGTTGGLVVEPPLHWKRDRWFLPTCRNVHTHLTRLSADGGRAAEVFDHILANPSSELTFYVAGQTLSDPRRSLDAILTDALERLYQPRSRSSADDLKKFFLDAETAYLCHLPADECGTLSLEPLVSDRAGDPIYLLRLNPTQRTEYARELERLETVFSTLRSDLRNTARAERILPCLRGVQYDLAGIR